jgi:oligopeptide transport system substrate-binding protein
MKHYGIRSLLAGAAILALSASASFAEVIFNRGNSADPESLDPHKTSTVYEANILRDLFMGLMIHNAKAELEPGAAESYAMSADGKVYTFKMRAGAKWSDGLAGDGP